MLIFDVIDFIIKVIVTRAVSGIMNPHTDYECEATS